MTLSRSRHVSMRVGMSMGSCGYIVCSYDDLCGIIVSHRNSMMRRLVDGTMEPYRIVLDRHWQSWVFYRIEVPITPAQYFAASGDRNDFNHSATYTLKLCLECDPHDDAAPNRPDQSSNETIHHRYRIAINMLRTTLQNTTA